MIKTRRQKREEKQLLLRDRVVAGLAKNFNLEANDPIFGCYFGGPCNVSGEVKDVELKDGKINFIVKVDDVEYTLELTPTGWSKVK